MSLRAGSVYVPCLKAVVQAAAVLGVDRKKLLVDAGVNPEQLKAPGERIALSRYLSAYRMAQERSGEPNIGLLVGHVMHVNSMNLHLYMTTICRNLKEYFNVIPSTIRIRGDTGRILIRPEGEFIRLEWHPGNGETAAWRPLARFAGSDAAPPTIAQLRAWNQGLVVGAPEVLPELAEDLTKEQGPIAVLRRLVLREGE